MSHFSVYHQLFSFLWFITSQELLSVSLYILLAAERSWPCVLTLSLTPGLCPSLVPAPSNALLRIAYLHNQVICKSSVYISSFLKCMSCPPFSLLAVCTGWSRCGHNQHLCFTPCLRRTACNLSSLKMLTVGFHGWASHQGSRSLFPISWVFQVCGGDCFVLLVGWLIN